MAISFMQKIRLALRGWSRRREEQQAEFLQRNVTWGKPADAQAPTRHPLPATRSASIDRDGLNAAYLDNSGKIAHFLDVESGEVIEFGASESRPEVTGDTARYRRVPARTSASEAEDRRAFVDALESPMRDQLAAADEADFRRIIATDRSIERAWYNFKNDRALAAIEAWLRREKLSG